MSFRHVPERCSTSFTNNLEHVSTFSYLDSFCRLDLNFPKGGINKICSRIRANDFALLNLKDVYKRRFVLTHVRARLQHYGATTRLSVALLWDYFVNLALTGDP